MPDRFRDFTEGEIHELRYALGLADRAREFTERIQFDPKTEVSISETEVADRHRLISELEQEQTRREHANRPAL